MPRSHDEMPPQGWLVLKNGSEERITGLTLNEIRHDKQWPVLNQPGSELYRAEMGQEDLNAKKPKADMFGFVWPTG